MLSLELAVGSLKTLLLRFLSSMSSRHLQVARLVTAPFRNARLHRRVVAFGGLLVTASLGRRSACSFTFTP